MNGMCGIERWETSADAFCALTGHIRMGHEMRCLGAFETPLVPPQGTPERVWDPRDVPGHRVAQPWAAVSRPVGPESSVPNGGQHPGPGRREPGADDALKRSPRWAAIRGVPNGDTGTRGPITRSVGPESVAPTGNPNAPRSIARPIDPVCIVPKGDGDPGPGLGEAMPWATGRTDRDARRPQRGPRPQPRAEGALATDALGSERPHHHHLSRPERARETTGTSRCTHPRVTR